MIQTIDPLRLAPMRIYVLWHSSCLQGEELARDIYKWFRGDPSDISQCGYGIPVEYRSYPFESESETLREIELDKADINVVVPLVNEHMVVSAHWREDLRNLANAHCDTACLICPVALHSTAYQLPEEITRLNFLRIDRASDSKEWSDERRLEIRRQRLLSLLTQVCCRLLWRQQDETGVIDINVPSSPIKVFISHAKADGTKIAEAIREQIYQQGQLQAFFDESDLAIGYAWERDLESSARLNTTAMIAVFTDAYASRPWCRREIRLAREVKSSQSRHLEIVSENTDSVKQSCCWYVKPLIVVDALSHGSSYFLPEFGYAPVVRWNPDRVSLLIDQLLREILLYGYNEKRGQLLPSRPGQYHLNCVPDLQTILELWQATEGRLTRVVMPPPGLPHSEEDRLRKFLQPELQITTFDQVMELDDQDISLQEDHDPLKNKLIAVSISNSSDLIRFGRGLEHLHELTISIARMVLRLGGNLAYGGDLRPGGFTETLFLLGRGEHVDKKGWERRLYSFLAWPFYRKLAASEEAQLINTCCFVRVGPKDLGLEEISDDKLSFDDPETVFQTIRCLSRMRELMTTGGAKLFDGQTTPPISARILIGGKTQDFMGIIPGLFEEYLLAAENNIPTYIIGGFGGAAHILSEALRAKEDQKSELTHENYRGRQTSLLAEKYKLYSAEQYKPYPEGPHPGQLYERLNTCLKRTRENRLEPLQNGLTTEENEKLMTSTSSQVILSLLSKGLTKVFRDQG